MNCIGHKEIEQKATFHLQTENKADFRDCSGLLTDNNLIVSNKISILVKSFVTAASLR